MNEFPEFEEELKDALKTIKKKNPEVFADRKQRDEIANSIITQVLKEKLKDYPTSISEDRAELRKSNLTNRRRMAIEIRLGEKVLLEEALAMLRARAEVDVPESEQRPVKKLKNRA